MRRFSTPKTFGVPAGAHLDDGRVAVGVGGANFSEPAHARRDMGHLFCQNLAQHCDALLVAGSLKFANGDWSDIQACQWARMHDEDVVTCLSRYIPSLYD